MEKDATKELEEIWGLLAEAGYDPFGQLSAYLYTGNSAYITRRGGIWERAECLDPAEIRQYLAKRQLSSRKAVPFC